MATVRDVGRFGSGLGISEVDYCHYRSGIAATTPPYSAGVDIHGSGGDWHELVAQTDTGIYKNAFGDQWTTGMGNQEAEDTYICTDIINHIIKICGFSEDLLMVRYITQQQWAELAHVVMHGFDDAKDFEVVKDDGFTPLGKPMLFHQRVFKSFLLYYKHKTLWEEEGPTEDEVMCWTPEEFTAYHTSKAYHDDHAEYCGPHSNKTPRTSNGTAHKGGNRLPAQAPSAGKRTGELTVQEFRRSVQRDIAHYQDLRDNKGFRVWNRGFIAKAKTHHTHLVLDEAYVPKSDEEKAVCQEMQIFMYAVMEEHLKTDKGRSIVSKYEADNDAQSIYREL
jgi:hypothetical protein